MGMSVHWQMAEKHIQCCAGFMFVLFCIISFIFNCVSSNPFLFLALESSVFWLMLNCCTFFLVLTNLKGIIFVDVFILLHLVRINSILSLCFQERSSESCLSLLQNSPLVSILILKSLVSMGMSFLMVFSHHLVTSPVHSG